MNDDLSDIRGRQDRLEGRVTQLEVTVRREANLRAKMDNDQGTVLAKLKAHEKSLNALRAVQSDHTVLLNDHTVRLTRIEADLVTVKTGVHAILDLLDGNLAKKSLAGRLAGRFTGRRDGGAGNG